MFLKRQLVPSFTILILLFFSSCSYKGNTIEKTIFIDAEKKVVWSALTNENELNKWWHTGVKLEPIVGGSFYEPWGNGQLATGSVLAVTPFKSIDFTWKEKSWNSKQTTNCKFSLEEKNGKTMLKVTHSGWKTFKNIEDRNKLLIGFKRGWGALLPKIKTYAEEKNQVPVL